MFVQYLQPSSKNQTQEDSVALAPNIEKVFLRDSLMFGAMFGPSFLLGKSVRHSRLQEFHQELSMNRLHRAIVLNVACVSESVR